MSKVTIKEVAAHAGVSPSSVSRYVNNPTSIKPIPALKIEQAIQELGYIPNTFARGLKQGTSNTIGVLVPSLGPYYAAICAALSDFFYQHNYLLFICETNDDAERQRYYVNSLIGQQVAGILAVLSTSNDEFFYSLYQHYPNIVLLDTNRPTMPFDAVYGDSRESAYKLTKYLIGQGHRQFILMFRTEYFANSSARTQGTKQALEEAGLSLYDMYLYYTLDPLSHSEDLAALIQKKPRPTAIIAYGPLYLENALTVLNQLGKKVPQDITLAGYALEDFSAKHKLDIPAIIQDPYEMGIQAGNMLLKRLRKSGEKLPKQQYCVKSHLTFPTNDI